jgi:hypothetical protein
MGAAGVCFSARLGWACHLQQQLGEGQLQTPVAYTAVLSAPGRVFVSGPTTQGPGRAARGVKQKQGEEGEGTEVQVSSLVATRW